MFVSILMVVCLYTPDTAPHCDVRVQEAVKIEAHSQDRCSIEADASMRRMIDKVLKEKPKHKLFAAKASCETLLEAANILSTLDADMDELGFTYKLKYYN